MKKIIAPLLIASISLYGEAVTVEVHSIPADRAAVPATAAESLSSQTMAIEQEIKKENALNEEKGAEIAEELKISDEPLLAEIKEESNAATKNGPFVETIKNLQAQSAAENKAEADIVSESDLEEAPVVTAPVPAVVSPAAKQAVAETAQSTEDESQQPSQQVPSMVGRASNQSANAARNRTWQNVAIAAGAVAIAVTALILVHNNRGHH